MTSLIDKYNRPVPRYTSYPPANFFSSSYTAEFHHRAVISSNSEGLHNLSFYIHIPFCPKLCHYCACNAYPMQTKQDVGRYMQALLKEIDLVCRHIDPRRPITQIHYGGGTPTAVPLEWLAEINGQLMSRFPLATGAEIAVECHPAYLNLKGWQQLCDAGFNRLSLGVQDFNPQVLRAVNRQASLEAFEDVFTLLRAQQMQVNLDLIYGLPLQTVASFSSNIERAIELSPDRLVTFAYAHIPWVKPQQNILQDLGLPSSEVRSQMFISAKELLTEAGYQSVGLDHFVRPNDPLAIAQQSKSLHRNFQGYCSRATTGQVYAFGVTAISQLSSSFCQNTKSIPHYIDQVNKGILPVERGYALKREERIAGEVIASIMCNKCCRWEEIALSLGCSLSSLKAELYRDEALLNSLADDGLIVMDEQGLWVQAEGEPFIRIIASAFDLLLKEQQGSNPYSLAL